MIHIWAKTNVGPRFIMPRLCVLSPLLGQAGGSFCAWLPLLICQNSPYKFLNFDPQIETSGENSR